MSNELKELLNKVKTSLLLTSVNCDGDDENWIKEVIKDIENYEKKYSLGEKDQVKVINFYRTQDSYGWASNFYPSPFILDGKSWPTVEHYFQSQKFITTDKDYAESIRLAQYPSVVAKMGRSRLYPLRPDWEEVKDDVMRVGLSKKFENTILRDSLLKTGDAKLVEHTKNDSYWGDGGDGSGKNMLGKLLMELRETL